MVTRCRRIRDKQGVCVCGLVMRLVAKLAEDTTLTSAVTSLGDDVMVLRDKSRYVDVYESRSRRLLRRVLINGLQEGTDMTSCTRHQCVYLADSKAKVIYRLSADRTTLSKWSVGDSPLGLSVTSNHNLLVTCPVTRTLKEFTTDGRLVREIVLERNVSSQLWHAVELSTGLYAVSYGGYDDDIHKVCTVNALGQIASCYGGRKGSSISQLNLPVHLLKVDDSVLVACLTNRRIIQLSSRMSYVGTIATRNDGLGGPFAMHYSEQMEQLYVADNAYSYWTDSWTSGNVKVFDINIELTDDTRGSAVMQ